MAAAPQQPLTFTDVFEDEDDAGEPREAPTIHHIRANSSIMQLKKILGEFPKALALRPGSLFQYWKSQKLDTC